LEQEAQNRGGVESGEAFSEEGVQAGHTPSCHIEQK
jgi:hypothetical protein